MRNGLLLCALLIGAGCSQPPAAEEAPQAPPAPAPAAATTPDEPPTPAPGEINLHTLAGTGLRFDGVYHHQMGSIQYYLRFFERGNVALIAGRQLPEDPVDLRSYLTQDAQSGVNNVHNAPVTLRNDSLFFTTMAVRGAITYAGVVFPDSVRLLKHSRITGKEEVITYRFQPY